MFGLSLMIVMFLIGGLLSIAGLIVILYSIYDIVVNQDRMDGLEKLIWILIILILNLVGAIIYLLFAYTGNTQILSEKDRELDELERLKNLLDDGAITEEEYEELKKDIIDDLERLHE